MDMRRISVRLNIDRLLHKKAYDILSDIPNGKKSEFVVNAIILAHDREEVMEMVKDAVHNAYGGKIPRSSTPNKNMENAAMDFLESL